MTKSLHGHCTFKNVLERKRRRSGFSAEMQTCEEKVHKWRAKELVTQVTPGLTQFALRQCCWDLRILVYLLTGHNTFNRHLTIMQRVNDPLCPLCKEEEKTSLHSLRKCCTTADIRRLRFGVPFLEPGDLIQAHWITLLKFVKTTKRFQ